MGIQLYRVVQRLEPGQYRVLRLFYTSFFQARAFEAGREPVLSLLSRLFVCLFIFASFFRANLRNQRNRFSKQIFLHQKFSLEFKQALDLIKILLSELRSTSPPWQDLFEWIKDAIFLKALFNTSDFRKPWPKF